MAGPMHVVYVIGSHHREVGANQRVGRYLHTITRTVESTCTPPLLYTLDFGVLLSLVLSAVEVLVPVESIQYPGIVVQYAVEQYPSTARSEAPSSEIQYTLQ